MCGVIGFRGANTLENMKKLYRLFIESSYRGVHATGYSVLIKDKITTVREPLPAKDFLEKHPLEFKTKELSLIGHTRYSTSDLEYNQPLEYTAKSGKTKAVVMNGVIDQSDPKTWEDKYKCSFSTSNDTEIISNFLAKNEREELFYELNGSYAIVELTPNGLCFYRNAYRPLWFAYENEALWVASTQDILKRTGLTKIQRCHAWTIYHNHNDSECLLNVEDEQPYTADYEHLKCKL